MHEKKSDTENLEDLLNKARKQKKSTKKLLIDYFTSVSEKEKVPIIGLDNKNRIIYVNELVKEVVGEERYKKLLNKKIYDFFDKKNIENYKSSIDEAHISGYDRVHFEFEGIHFTAVVKKDICAVVTVRKESLREHALSFLHKTKITIGKTIYDAERNHVCEMDIIEAFYTRRLLGISLDFLVKTVTEDVAKQVIEEVIDYLANTALKGESTKILVKAKKLTKQAVRLLAYIQYDNERHKVLASFLGRGMAIKLHSPGRYKKRFDNYVHDFKSQRLTLNDAQLESLETAVKGDVDKFKDITAETRYSRLVDSFRNAFRRMLKDSNIYQLLPEEISKKSDISDPLIEKAEKFLGKIRLEGPDICKFYSLVTPSDGKKRKSIMLKDLKELYNPIFERYMQVQSFYLFRQHKKE